MSPMDYQEHERTYTGFLKLLKFAMTAIIVILALMALFLT
ncbi:aa3-type cytochrome c oxidase subunit IV [Amorphus sp. 3PC139-8]